MAAITAPLIGYRYTLSIKIGSAAYTDITTRFMSIDAPASTRVVTPYRTGDSDSEKGLVGGYTSGDLTINVLYTEADAEAWSLLWDAHRAGTAVQVKWVVSGGGTHETLEGGYVKECPPPTADASSTDPLAVAIVIWIPGYKDFTAAA